MSIKYQVNQSDECASKLKPMAWPSLVMAVERILAKGLGSESQEEIFHSMCDGYSYRGKALICLTPGHS